MNYNTIAILCAIVIPLIILAYVRVILPTLRKLYAVLSNKYHAITAKVVMLRDLTLVSKSYLLALQAENDELKLAYGLANVIVKPEYVGQVDFSKGKRRPKMREVYQMSFDSQNSDQNHQMIAVTLRNGETGWIPRSEVLAGYEE